MFSGERVTVKLGCSKVHRAEDCEELLLPEVNRQEPLHAGVVSGRCCLCSADDLRVALEERGGKFATRISASGGLDCTSRSRCRG